MPRGDKLPVHSPSAFRSPESVALVPIGRGAQTGRERRAAFDDSARFAVDVSPVPPTRLHNSIGASVQSPVLQRLREDLSLAPGDASGEASLRGCFKGLVHCPCRITYALQGCVRHKGVAILAIVANALNTVAWVVYLAGHGWEAFVAMIVGWSVDYELSDEEVSDQCPDPHTCGLTAVGLVSISTVQAFLMVFASARVLSSTTSGRGRLGDPKRKVMVEPCVTKIPKGTILRQPSTGAIGTVMNHYGGPSNPQGRFRPVKLVVSMLQEEFQAIDDVEALDLGEDSIFSLRYLSEELHKFYDPPELQHSRTQRKTDERLRAVKEAYKDSDKASLLWLCHSEGILSREPFKASLESLPTLPNQPTIQVRDVERHNLTSLNLYWYGCFIGLLISLCQLTLAVGSGLHLTEEGLRVTTIENHTIDSVHHNWVDGDAIGVVSVAGRAQQQTDAPVTCAGNVHMADYTCPEEKYPRPQWETIVGYTEGACCSCPEKDPSEDAHAACVLGEDPRFNAQNQCTDVMRYIACDASLACASSRRDSLGCQACAEAAPYLSFTQRATEGDSALDVCTVDPACKYTFNLIDHACVDIHGRCVGNHDLYPHYEADIVCSGTGSSLLPNAAAIEARDQAGCCTRPCACFAVGGFKGIGMVLEDAEFTIQVSHITTWMVSLLFLQVQLLHAQPATAGPCHFTV